MKFPRLLRIGEERRYSNFWVRNLTGDDAGPLPPDDIPNLQMWLMAWDGPFANTAAEFTRVNLEFLSIADNADLSAADINLEFNLWVYLTSKPAEPMVFMSKWGGVVNEYRLRWDNADDRFKFAVGATEVIAATFGAPAAGAWHNIRAGHDPVVDQIFIAVNNGAADTAAHALGVTDSTGEFDIGRQNDALDKRYLDGRVQQCRVFKNVLLTTAQRDDLWNAGKGRKEDDLLASIKDKSLADYPASWPLDEESAGRRDLRSTNTLADNATVTANHGKIETLPLHGMKVAKWYERAGFGGNPAQTTHSKKPLYQIKTVNGKTRSFVVFDGVDDILVAADAASVKAQPITIIGAFSFADAAGQHVYDANDSVNRVAMFATGGVITTTNTRRATKKVYTPAAVGCADDANKHGFDLKVTGTTEDWTYVGWDFTPVTTVVSATLRVWVATAPASSQNIDIFKLLNVDETWSESAMTCSTRKAADGLVMQTFASGTTVGPIDIALNATAVARLNERVGIGNVSLLLKPGSGSTLSTVLANPIGDEKADYVSGTVGVPRIANNQNAKASEFVDDHPSGTRCHV